MSTNAFLASTYTTGAADIHVIRDLFTHDARAAMGLDESPGTAGTKIIRMLLADVYPDFFAK